MRAFIGIRVHAAPEILVLLERIKSIKCGKTVEPENLHVNLKFFGEISAEQAQRIAEAVDGLRGFGGFEMRLKGVAAFPSEKRPRVIWVGVDSPEMLRLHETLDAVLEKQGFAREERFSPHVTLARIKQKNPELQKLFSGKAFGVQRAESVCLVESRLSKTGPTYVDVHAVTL